MSAENLYDDVMMDHIKNARNYREIPAADRKAEAVNRLCGDEITVYLRLREERIEDVAFRCASCGISMASASIMTEAVKGKTSAEARNLSHSVRAMIEGDAPARAVSLDAQLAAVLATLKSFPARKSCAALAWHALSTALDGQETSVSVG